MWKTLNKIHKIITPMSKPSKKDPKNKKKKKQNNRSTKVQMISNPNNYEQKVKGE